MNLCLSETSATPGVEIPQTQEIQAAIDRVHAAGGGRVTVPAGCWMTGMLHLRSRVELHLARGACLKAAPRPEDSLPLIHVAGKGDHWRSPEGSFHVIAAVDCEEVALTGPGRVDGNGTAFYDPVEPGTAWPLARHKDWRRMGAMVLFSSCRRVRVAEVNLGNVCNWTLHLHDCDHVQVRDVVIENPAQAPNSDGIDITGCQNVTVSGCHIDTGDDAICIKTLPGGRPAENIQVSHCILRTHCVALKLGATESFQDMRCISFSDCVVRGSHRAVGLYSLEGGMLEQIRVENVVFDTCAALMFPRPIHVDIRRHRPQSRLGGLRGLYVQGLSGMTQGRCVITAEAGAVCEDLVFKDIHLQYPVIEDPAHQAKEHGGTQFSNQTPWARTARALWVFENVRRCRLESVSLRWPEGPAPAAWQPETKLANGTHRLFVPEDWEARPGTVFAAVASKNLIESQIDPSLLEAEWEVPAS